MRHATKTVAANDRAIKATKPIEGERTTERKVAGVPGLWLYVYPSGRKAFHVHYSVRIDGKQVKRKPRLGEYGDHGPVTLSDARRRALEMMGRVEAGRDPVAEDEMERAARRRAILTFSDMADDYIADHRAQGHASSDEVERVLKKLLREDATDLAQLQVNIIAPLDIERAVDAVRDRVLGERGVDGSRGEMARRCLRYVKQVFNHVLHDSAELREKYGLRSNPADGVGRNRRGKLGRYGKAEPKERFLVDAEIVAFWWALDNSNIDVRACRNAAPPADRRPNIRAAARRHLRVSLGRRGATLDDRCRQGPQADGRAIPQRPVVCFGSGAVEARDREPKEGRCVSL